MKSNDPYGVQDYEELPLKHQLDAYVNNLHPVGSFLYAILTNDLKNAFARADSRNLPYIHTYVKYVYNQMPTRCRGSEEAVKNWLYPE